MNNQLDFLRSEQPSRHRHARWLPTDIFTIWLSSGLQVQLVLVYAFAKSEMTRALQR
jgi:hypothetical protein